MPYALSTSLKSWLARCMSLLWFQHNPLPTDWMAQREVVAAFDV